jgi:hypothetical protein
VADSAISLAILLLLISAFVSRDEARPRDPETPGA